MHLPIISEIDKKKNLNYTTPLLSLVDWILRSLCTTLLGATLDHRKYYLQSNRLTRDYAGG